MSQAVTTGKHAVISAVTTCTELVFSPVRPTKISVQATTADAYVRIADGVDGAAIGTDFWLVPAGQTHDIDISGIGQAVNIAAASASTVYIWSVR